MHESVASGGQFVVATHSPLLMSFPGARLYELDSSGIRSVRYDDLEVVELWRGFLDEPNQFLRHLFADD